MISSLIGEFKKSNFTELDVNDHKAAIYYQVKDEGVYIVSLFECVNNKEDSSEEIIETYHNRMSRIKWNFINRGYRNINVLHVVVSEDVSLAKRFIKSPDAYWIVNTSTDQLVIFENQISEFLDVKESIEKVLALKVEKLVGEMKENKVSKVIASLSPIAVTCIILFFNTAIFIVMDMSYDSTLYRVFVERGGISYDLVVKDHQYYRFLTHMFIHADMDHLLGNMMVLFFIGTLLEKKLGRLNYITMYFIGGIVAAITSLGYNRLDNSATLSIGASGAIFAVVGAMIAIVIFNKREFEEIGIQRLLFFVVITIISGLNSKGIDNAAHVGGLLAGLVLGQALYLGVRKKKQKNSI